MAHSRIDDFTEKRRNAPKPTADEILSAGCAMDGAAFLSFFESRHKRIADAYRKLAQEQGVSSDYEATALLVILLTRPRCCHGIAYAYVEDAIRRATIRKKEHRDFLEGAVRAGFMVYTADKIIGATGTKRKYAETDDEGTDDDEGTGYDSTTYKGHR